MNADKEAYRDSLPQRSEDIVIKTESPAYIAMLDPSAFTIPYDIHLCRGLVNAGAAVDLFTRTPRSNDYFNRRDVQQAGANQSACQFAVVEHFYNFSETSSLLRNTSRAKSIVKAAEHAINLRSLAIKLRERSPHVVHFQWMVLPICDRDFVRRMKRTTPVVLTVHDTSAFHAPTSRMQLVGWLSAVRDFHRIIVHTQESKEILTRKGVAIDRIAVIPHGVLRHGEDLGHANSSENSERLSLLAFGAIKYYKGLDVLIKALAQLSEGDRSQVQLVVAGMPSIPEAELRNLAIRCGVDNCIEWRLRFIADNEVPKLFSRCDVVVFPYRQIDASGALMTALPFGKAIVASRIGVFGEQLTHGQNALLVEPEDSEGLAGAISSLIRDRDLARRLGRCSGALADSTFSWETIAQLTLAAYGDAVMQHQLDSSRTRNPQTSAKA